MLICPNATKIYVKAIVKTQQLNYTKYFAYVETFGFYVEKQTPLHSFFVSKNSKMPCHEG